MNLILSLKNNQLVKSSVIYTIGGFILKGINLITFPLFSRFLTPEDYGITTLFSTWVGIIVIFTSLQLNSCIPKAKIKYKDNEFNDLIITILSFTTIIFLSLTIVSIITKKKLSLIIGLNENLIILMVIQSFFTFIDSLYKTILIQDKKDKKYLIVSFILTISNVIVSLLLIVLMKEYKYLGRIMGGFISTIIVGFIIYISICKGHFFINKELLKFALNISIPVIPHVLSSQILTSSDRVMLNNFVSAGAIGIYSFSYNIGMIIQIFKDAVNSAWVPWYYENMKLNNYKKIEEYSKKYIMMFTVITILLIFITPELAKIMAPKSYWGAIKIIPIISLSYFFVFLYTFSVNIEFYYEKTKYIPIGTVLAAVINIILNILFISKYGIIGATISTLVSYILLFIFHLGIVKFMIKYEDSNIRYYILSSLIVSIFVAIFYVTINNLILRYLILSSVFVYLFIKINNIKKILRYK